MLSCQPLLMKINSAGRFNIYKLIEGWFLSTNSTNEELPRNYSSSELEPCDRDYYGIGKADNLSASCLSNFNEGIEIGLNCYPMGMNPQSKFGYTLFFILVPWPFFIYEYVKYVFIIMID